MKTNLIGKPTLVFDGRKCTCTNLKGDISKHTITDEMIRLYKTTGIIERSFMRFPLWTKYMTEQYLKQQPQLS